MEQLSSWIQPTIIIAVILFTTRIQLNSLSKRIDDLRHQMSRELDALAKKVDETNRRIDDTNKRIDDTNKRIDDTNKRIEITNQRMDQLNNHFMNHLQWHNVPPNKAGND